MFFPVRNPGLKEISGDTFLILFLMQDFAVSNGNTCIQIAEANIRKALRRNNFFLKLIKQF
jgi:hypothetical protein